METPNVLNKLTDPKSNVVYEVLAYRKLTKEELMFAVRYYLASRKKRPKKGSVIRIYSTIGHDR